MALSGKIKSILDDLKDYLQSLYGAQLCQVVLFGSQAREDASPESDIDVLVVLRDAFDYSLEVDRTGDKVSMLSLENDGVISCLFMEESRFLKENSPLLLNIRREGVIL